MKADLKTRLRANAALAALVAARVHWLRRPRNGALGAVTLSIVGAGREYCHAGAVGLSRPRVRTETWGATEAQATEIADALTVAIEAIGTTGTTTFKGAFLEMEQGFDPETMGDGAEVVRILRDFTLWHQPAG
jgi:hypothetical protein